MDNLIKKIVVVGGGSAGWLAAGTLAAKNIGADKPLYDIVLVESPDVSTIGVGEGTWPTMRGTLKVMGIDESQFIRECDVAFKQGAKFVGWVNGQKGDFYYHPLELPNGYFDCDMAKAWYQQQRDGNFSPSVCVQEHLCEANIAPKLITTPQFAAIANYAYHLDAGKFGEFLKHHCINKLGVRYVRDHVTGVNACADTGNIISLSTRKSCELHGDLFIDCSGKQGVLIGKHYQVPWTSKKDVLFIDKAIAVQVPYQETDTEIPPYTVSTAQSAGWIWDIGLQSRRGVGHVYSSQHSDESQAFAELHQYLKATGISDVDHLSFKTIDINPGIREKFWVNNCVAVGMAAGFLEPLEASALVMVELAAAAISEYLPADKQSLTILAEQFNEKFHYNWQRIIDFLKLHYLASQRNDTSFWSDNRLDSTVPDTLRALLAMWQYRAPSEFDFGHKREVFSAASYQYVLYGMKVMPHSMPSANTDKQKMMAQRFLEQTQQQIRQFPLKLSKHRALLNTLKHHSFQAL
ncbi:tryptophan halogenase family protein [Thalassotalea ganghwensis]